jgi:D-3-phosphoglycerate dehydrogenase
MRVLVTETIAENGLESLRKAGFEVDVQEGLSPEQLQSAIKGAHGLIIRSATQVTPDILQAADSLIAIGRAGIGVDNIDVSAATSHGVMVINAPQSNITSAAEHAIALMLSLARHIPNAHRDLVAGQWNRSKYEGVEISGKKVGIVGLGRVGTIVATRIAAFDADILAYDPFISEERARELGVTLYSSLEEFIAACDIVSVHLPKTPETVGLINADVLKNAQPHMLLINTARGGIVNEADLNTCLREGIIAGAGLDVFDAEPTTESPLFELDNIVVTPHLGASTTEAQDKAGITIAEQITLALNGDFVPFALNLDAKGANATVSPFIAVAETCGRIAAGLVDGAIEEMNVSAEGQIAEHDCSMLTLAALTGILKNTTDEPVSLVNAPDVAKSRGLSIKDARSSDSGEFLSRLTVTATTKQGSVSVSGTALRRNGEVRIIQIDDHVMDVPRSSHFVIVANDDVPGIVGKVGTLLGEANVNIDDMALGRDAHGQHAIMIIATTNAVPETALAELNAAEGIRFARSISLT